MAALAAVTGCGGVSPDAAAAPSANLALNGPYGPGGPFTRTGGPAAARPAAAAAAAVRVSGSTGFNSIHGVPWLPSLGYGVDVSAPPVVRLSTAAPEDAEAGFYDAFYARRPATACGYVAPAQRARCPASLRQSDSAAGSLRDAAIGFVVTKGNEAVVTMTGLVCGGRTAPTGCLGQHDPAWIFGYAVTFDALWARIAKEGGNPLTATPLRRVAGHWYVDLTSSAAG